MLYIVLGKVIKEVSYLKKDILLGANKIIFSIIIDEKHLSVNTINKGYSCV
jgi:hypothetical protein